MRSTTPHEVALIKDALATLVTRQGLFDGTFFFSLFFVLFLCSSPFTRVEEDHLQECILVFSPFTWV